MPKGNQSLSSSVNDWGENGVGRRRGPQVTDRESLAWEVGTLIASRPSGWVGTIAKAGRVVKERENAVTSVRYSPLCSGRQVVNDQWPVLSALVAPASFSSLGLVAGLSPSLIIDPGAAVPENTG